MDTFEKEFERRFEVLSQKYRGLRKESLEYMNPEYSCVVCSKVLICSKSREGCSCPNAEPATEEQFALTYDFK